jgi:GNAT superfamily N-acetyltransferase
MNSFGFTFVNAKNDENEYTNMLKRAYQEEYGYTIHENVELYSGYHSSIVCRHRGKIIGGISAYISDQKRKDQLPMERRGIHLEKYAKLKGVRYAEICRIGVLKEYRKHNVLNELMERCYNFCVRIGCESIFWVAKKFHSKLYEMFLLSRGARVTNLDNVKYLLNTQEKGMIKIDYCLCYSTLPVPEL